MRIIRGKVKDTFDTTRSGGFNALFEDISDKPLPVIYTSPMYRVNGGGIIALPEVEDEILAVLDESTDEIFYHSTIVAPSVGTFKIDDPFYSTVKNNVYNTGQIPVRVRFEDGHGQGLSIAKNDEPPPTSPLSESSVMLHSLRGKKVILEDSVDVDRITIHNQHAHGITIQGDSTKTGTFFGRAKSEIEIRSPGPHYYVSDSSEMQMRIVDGRDLKLINTSTGFMGVSASQEYWPNGPSEQAPKRWGGIYVKSENGDISIASKASDGRIFLTTPGAKIQIVTKGDGSSDIRVECNGDLSMDASGSINLRAGGNFNVQANDINFNSNQNVITAAGNVAAISSGGDMALDGATINLNSGISPTPTAVTIPNTLLDDYSDNIE